MKLIDNNKKYIIFSKVYDRIYIKEYNIRESDWNIMQSKQKIRLKDIMLSNFLLFRIRNEIN